MIENSGMKFSEKKKDKNILLPEKQPIKTAKNGENIDTSSEFIIHYEIR